jgi:hypothetical protein
MSASDGCCYHVVMITRTQVFPGLLLASLAVVHPAPGLDAPVPAAVTTDPAPDATHPARGRRSAKHVTRRSRCWRPITEGPAIVSLCGLRS